MMKNANAIPLTREQYDAMLQCLHLEPINRARLNEMNNYLVWNESRAEAIKVFKWQFRVLA